MSSSGNIWRPSTAPNELQLPVPGSSQVQNNYTKTSLAALTEDRDSQIRQNLNKQILAASQAYNDTPKPYGKSQDSSMVNNGPRFATSSTNPSHGFETDQSDACLGRQGTPAPSRGNFGQNDMSPRLVHKQYNSPIDLYSMNNIRKTIEAHTEMIAPGLKGINFKKHEAPINKESEVYKLIKEEEQRKQHRSSDQMIGSRLSPISGQPVKLSGISRESSENYQSDLSLQNHSSMSLKSCSLGARSSSGPQSQDTEQVGRPKCFECGQFIVGPFAKIQNRCVHPQCFNCTTCGSSLKNTGHFTINDKLYCEIHARQVAKMMRIQYNFDDRRQQQQSNLESQIHSQQQVSSSNTDFNQSSYGSTRKVDGPTSSTMRSPATISTMFSSRTESETESTGFDKKEIQWAWRPMTSKDSSTLVNCSSRDQSITRGASADEQRSLQRDHRSDFHIVQGGAIDQQTTSFNKVDRSSVQDDYAMRCSRVPICVYCHVQIQGPYLMAGKTTWCKLCSQTHFNCNSCHRSLLDTGFVEDNQHKYYCENCFEAYYAPICSKCNLRIKGDCLNALGKQWHPSCFVCGHCRRPFGNSSFYLEDNVPYCERDWNLLFTTKCYSCSYPIEAGDKWILALDRNYHSNCFKCSSCQSNLEGSTFYCKNGKPYCRLHAR